MIESQPNLMKQARAQALSASSSDLVEENQEVAFKFKVFTMLSKTMMQDNADNVIINDNDDCDDWCRWPERTVIFHARWK